MFGAALAGTPVSVPEYVKTVRPAVRLGRGVFQRASVELSSGSTLYFLASVEGILHLLEFVGHSGREIVVFGRVLLDVVEFPVVTCDHIGRRFGAQLPRQRHRRCGRHPPVLIDGAIAKHLEVLRRVSRRRVGIWLCPTCTPCSRPRWGLA